MAYDRYDSRRDREWRGSDNDRNWDRGGRGADERGFFERAGDEIASWFGDDDAERRRRDDDRMNRGGWGRDDDRDRSAFRGSGRDRDFDRDRSSARPMNWTSSDRDYRSGRSGYAGYDRDMSYRGGFAGTSTPDYMSPTGPSFGYGGSYGAGTSSGYGSGGFGREYNRDSDRSYRPMAGDYGRSDRSDSPWARDDYRRTSFAGSASGSGRDNDRHYHSWRQRQLDELDRDYDQYCRERQNRFESDFGTWREGRMSKRRQLGSIREHMDVVGSDGESVGKVDCVKGDHIVLTKSDSDDNRHHRIDCSMIQSIEGDQVRLELPAEEAKSRFESSDERGFFGRDNERDRERDRGPDHEANLERSFSGTYDES